MHRYFLILLLWAMAIHTQAQDKWQVPDLNKNMNSPLKFDEDQIKNGEQMFENSCVSCHGMPTQKNFAMMSPSPGDPAGSKFQTQTDGEIFYKIKNGRGGMPRFENMYSDEDVWSLVAYIRSFNKEYKQPEIKEMEGRKYDLKVKISFDKFIDKLVVKVSADSLPVDSALTTAYLKGKFGKLLLDKKYTSKEGIVWFDVDNEFPGDTTGSLVFLVKVKKGLSEFKVQDTLQAKAAHAVKSATEGRHLWSISKKAPVWLIIIFWGITIGVWMGIAFIVVSTLNLNKIKD